jgi:hypothetical protein
MVRPKTAVLSGEQAERYRPHESLNFLTPAEFSATQECPMSTDSQLTIFYHYFIVFPNMKRSVFDWTDTRKTTFLPGQYKYYYLYYLSLIYAELRPIELKG